jgi:hypothetical protein
MYRSICSLSNVKDKFCAKCGEKLMVVPIWPKAKHDTNTGKKIVPVKRVCPNKQKRLDGHAREDFCEFIPSMQERCDGVYADDFPPPVPEEALRLTPLGEKIRYAVMGGVIGMVLTLCLFWPLAMVYVLLSIMAIACYFVLITRLDVGD